VGPLDTQDIQKMTIVAPIFREKYLIFCDLWHKGYYITEGSKFGADYLVYSGDPSCFHAQFLVLVKQYTEFFIVDEMVTLTRLANSVKKKK